MRAMIFEERGRARVVDYPEPVARPGEVVISVEAAGLCGSDIHAFQGSFPAAFPYVPGHEFAGQVIAAGTDSDASWIGKRVAVHPLRPCHRCLPCKAGRINFCESLQIYGGDLPGGFAERVAVSIENLYVVPDEVSLEEAAWSETLSCVLHGLELIGVRMADRVALFGAGSIGQLMVQACKAMGAQSVTVVELDPARREIAARWGATAVDAEDTLSPSGYDLVIDATGVPQVVRRLPLYTRDGGRMLYFGVCPPDAEIAVSPYEIFRRELTIAGCFSLTSEMASAIAFLASGAIQVGPLISQRVDLESAPELLEHFDERRGSSIKTLIIP